MTVSDAATPLEYPPPFADVPSYLLVVNVSRQEAAERLGPVQQTDRVDGLGDLDLWAFAYPCGLQVAFRFGHNGDSGFVWADSPEIDHVQRHIPFGAAQCTRIDEATLQRELQRLLKAWPNRQAEIDALRSYQVWRQGTDGNPFRIGQRTSLRDAQCRVRHFESLGHHQHYWLEKVKHS